MGLVSDWWLPVSVDLRVVMTQPGWIATEYDWWWRPWVSVGRAQRIINIPLWVPLLLVSGLTALLWWRDRRVPAGHCEHCRYDLTGNVSGVCPECGHKVPRACHSEGTK